MDEIILEIMNIMCVLLRMFEEEELYYKLYENTLLVEDEILKLRCSLRRPVLRISNYVEEIIPLYDDIQFKSHFRMRRSTFDFIFELIHPLILTKNTVLPPEKQFLIAIWKMATPDSYRSICEKFNVAQSTALESVRRVTKALLKLSTRFITWPDEEKAAEISRGFAATSVFPGVIGAIDGTHINIKAPYEHPECYVDRKGHHSIKLQAVCDHKARFIHCVAGYVGSVHDQRVFRLSEVCEYLQDPTKFPNNTHLVGDGAYKLHDRLMVPFRDNGHLSDRQKNYNFCLSSAQMTIERSFGLLKGRFRSLLTVLDMARVDLIPEFIIACCVLHNICLMKGDEFSDLQFDNDNINLEQFEPVQNVNGGNEKRDTICNNLIMRNV